MRFICSGCAIYHSPGHLLLSSILNIVCTMSNPYTFSLSATRRSIPRQCRPRNLLTQTVSPCQLSHRHQHTPLPHRNVRTLTTTPTCPPPTLSHAPQPPNLDIDRKLPLIGSMAAHHGHIIIPTGRSDWKSKVEEDDAGIEGSVIRGLKEMLGPRGDFANVSIYCCS